MASWVNYSASETDTDRIQKAKGLARVTGWHEAMQSIRCRDNIISALKTMKSVLITGANSGFGYLTALTFARKGWHVYATARDLSKEGVSAINAIAKNENLSIEWIRIDVTDSSTIRKAAQYIQPNGLDVLVNNAGYGVKGRIDENDLQSFRDQFETNVFGLMDVTYNFLPHIIASKGRIINISSIAGRISVPGLGVYSASKHAVEAISEALRGELYKDGVKIIAIEPGGFNTNFGKNVIDFRVANGKPNWFLTIFHNSKTTGLGAYLRDPQRVADKIYYTAKVRSPKLRYLVGLDAKFAGFAKRTIPDRVWDFLVKTFA